MKAKDARDCLVWIDLEMTGLDPKKCTVLEIGAVVTDGQLNEVAASEPIAIHHGDRVLERMEAWSKHHHGKSGLTQACRDSRTSLKQAEAKMLDFVKRYCAPKTTPLCGNTIWQDRRFLIKYMPKLEAHFHYRNVDVSSIKELVGRWYPNEFKLRRKRRQAHRVMDDIRESIDELRHYQQKVFRPQTNSSPPPSHGE